MEKITSEKQFNARSDNKKLIIARRNKSIVKDTHSSDDYVNLGLFHLDNRDYDKALECFQKITELEPNNPKTFINLGYIYERMDMLDSAKKCYEK
ncbi:MAG: tetratricopeptide repeat protein, partial [Smithella sp.]